MILMYKEINDRWVWTAEDNLNYELSPEYETQVKALQWRGDVSFEIHRDHSLVVSGKRVVIPVSRNHAHMILDNVVKYLQTSDNYQSPAATTTKPSTVSTPLYRPAPTPAPSPVVNDNSDPTVPALPG